MLYKFSAWTHLSNFDQPGHKNWTVVERDQRVTMVRKVSSLLVFLNDWLNFCVRDQFEIKMLIVRGHSDINTTLTVIISLFCCRSICLYISLWRCLCLFILALSLVCLPAFFTIIFSPSSRPDSFYLPTFFAKILSSTSTSNALSLAMSSLALRVSTIALCRSPSLCSLLKICRLHAKISLLLFVDIIAFVSCNKKL